MENNELDVQITSIHFVLLRETDASWHMTCTPPKKRRDPLEQTCVLALARSGAAHYSFGGGSRQAVTNGNILFMRESEARTAETDREAPWSFYSCAFTLRAADHETMKKVEEMPNIFRCSDSAGMREAFSLLHRIWSARSGGYLLKCRSILYDILYMLLLDEKRRELCSAHDRIIDEIAELIRADCTRAWTLAELAAMSGLSASYFRRLFKQQTGTTTVEFRNRVRIERAKDLLASRTCSVTEAAEIVGFSDVFYFSRMFKRLVGKSPSAFAGG